jgi:hypothetical protein
MMEPARKTGRTIDEVAVDVVRSEFDDAVLQRIIAVVLAAVDKYVITPTQNTMSKEDANPLLQREVERTTLVPICQQVKRQLDEQVGGTFHVAYGRSFGLHISHERCNFAHVRVDDADVVVWRH